MTLFSFIAGCFARLQRPAAVNAAEFGSWLSNETASFPEMLARIAESQIGVREGKKNNTGERVVEYQKATWLQPGPWAWCAAFVCWCIFQTLSATGIKPLWTRPRTAGAYDLERWAAGTGDYKKAQPGWTVLEAKTSTPKRGDIVTFTWSHVGIVVGYDAKAHIVHTVEGNTGGHTYQVSDSTSGDGVFKKAHKLHECRRFIRLTA